MAMLPVPLQTETRPSDGLAITWVGVSGAIRYGLIIGVPGVPVPDLDVIMRGQTKQFALVGVPARFTGLVDIGTPAGATRQFGLVAYRSDGGIFPISPLNIFPARSAPRDREYHAVVPPALVEVAPTQQTAQTVRANDPNDPWSALGAGSNTSSTPAAPVTFTAPQPSAETQSFTFSQPSTPTVPHTPAPYDPWDVLSQSSVADAPEEEPAAEPVEEEASAGDWSEPSSFTEPPPSYSGSYEAPSQARPVEPEPPIKAIADTPVSPIEAPARPVVEPADAFPAPVRFEPYRPAVVNEPEIRQVDAPPVAAEPVSTRAEAAAGPIENEAPAPTVFAEAASTVRPIEGEREHSRQTSASAGSDAEPTPVRSVESDSQQTTASEAERPIIAEIVSKAPEPLADFGASEPASEAAVVEDVTPPAPSDSRELSETWASLYKGEPVTEPIADHSGEGAAIPAANDAERPAVEPTATPTPVDWVDRSATPVARDSGEVPAIPAVAERNDRQDPSAAVGAGQEAVTQAIPQATVQPTTPEAGLTWAPIETAPLAAEPAPSPRAENEGRTAGEEVASAASAEAWPAVKPTPAVETRAEAPIARTAEPAPIEPEPGPPAPPLPADLGALLDEAELYLLPQWADSDAALSLAEQVEREAPGHPRTRAIRARIESMRSAGGAGSDQGDSTQIAGLLEKAGRSMNDRDYWGAVDYYEQALAEKPDHDEAQTGLAKARLRARWPSQLAGAGSDVAALRALGRETEGEAPDLAGQAYAAAFAGQPAPDVLRLWLSAFAHAGYGGVLADTARRAVLVLEESGRILPTPAVAAALEGLEQTAGAGGTETEAAINRLCDELVGAGQ